MAMSIIFISQAIFFGGVGFGIMRNMPNQDLSLFGGIHPILTLRNFGIYAEPENASTRVENGSVVLPIHYRHWTSNQHLNVSMEVYRPINRHISFWMHNSLASQLERGHNHERFVHRNVEIVHLTNEEAALWGVEKGIVTFFHIRYTDEEAVFWRMTDESEAVFVSEMVLLNGRTIVWLSIHGEDIYMEAIARAVRGLFSD